MGKEPANSPSSLRVLLVEDDICLRMSLEFILQRAGYVVTCAACGEDALQVAARDVPDLILLDVGLPGMDGLTACQRLRVQPETRHVRILMVSGRRAVEDELLGFERLADDYLTKPFHPRVLLAHVRAVLRRGARLRIPPESARGLMQAILPGMAYGRLERAHAEPLAGWGDGLGDAQAGSSRST